LPERPEGQTAIDDQHILAFILFIINLTNGTKGCIIAKQDLRTILPGSRRLPKSQSWHRKGVKAIPDLLKKRGDLVP
jgi:hypothetical protein